MASVVRVDMKTINGRVSDLGMFHPLFTIITNTKHTWLLYGYWDVLQLFNQRYCNIKGMHDLAKCIHLYSQFIALLFWGRHFVCLEWEKDVGWLGRVTWWMDTLCKWVHHVLTNEQPCLLTQSHDFVLKLNYIMILTFFYN